MVRRKVEIKKIEDKAKRHTTFTKRRQGLFKKAKDLSDRSGDEVAIIAFSLAGNVYAFGSPSVESIVNRYENTEKHPHAPESGTHAPHVPLMICGDEEDETEEEDEGEGEEDDFGLGELDKLEAIVEEMKNKVSDLTKHVIKNM